MADRLSQETVEALYGTTAARARLSQETVEAAYSTSAARARLSQMAVEVLYLPPSTTYEPRQAAINFQDPALF